MTVYILGGGPAGLALADGIASETSERFVLFERDSMLGGLAKTIPWKNYGFHDLGPHKIFTLDQDLLKKVKSLLDESLWLNRPKKSSIYMKGHYLPYPPSPFSLLSVYGLFKFSYMSLGYFSTKVKSLFNGAEDTAQTFEEDLINRLGKPLYQALFEPLALKLWGDPKTLDLKLSKGRVQTPSLTEVVLNLLKLRSSSSFEALEFIYPKGGLQKLWDAIYKKTALKGEFFLNTSVVSIEFQEGRAVSIEVNEYGSKKTIPIKEEDFIFSTLPLGLLARLMKGDVNQELVELVDKTILLNDLVLVFFKIKNRELFSDSWIFIPDPNIPFHRISEQNAFDPSMTPNGSILCCEIMSTPKNNNSSLKNSILINMALEGLNNMGFSNLEVEDSKVIKLPKSYPVYTVGFQERLQKILEELDSFNNFKTVGRQGSFNYIGTLDAMDIGYGAANWLKQALLTRDNINWRSERERTSFYPVLD